MKRLIIIRPTDRQVSGRGRQGRLQKHFFFLSLSFRPLPSFLPSFLPVSGRPRPHSITDSMSDCTALHCTALLSAHCTAHSTHSIPSSSFPKWPHKQALTAAADGQKRRKSEDAIHTFLTLRTATHSLFTTQRRKEGDGDPRSFPTFALSLSSIPSSPARSLSPSLPLSRSRSLPLPVPSPLLSSADAGCEKRDPLLRHARARACRQACERAPFGLAREIRNESRELRIEYDIEDKPGQGGNIQWGLWHS